VWPMLVLSLGFVVIKNALDGFGCGVGF